jgi:hypothetical protein
MASFAARLERLERAIAFAAPELMILEIRHDPERRRAGPDQCEIGGVVYERADGEGKDVWLERLRVAALSAGARMIAISLAQDYGLEDYRDDDLDLSRCVEISGG